MRGRSRRDHVLATFVILCVPPAHKAGHSMGVPYNFGVKLSGGLLRYNAAGENSYRGSYVKQLVWPAAYTQWS